MQKWEYLVAQWVGEGEPRVKQANGEDLAGWEAGTLHGFLKEAGSQGWELVGTMNRGATPMGFLVFKRPG